ncbi:MAG TPA: hypothetical protein IGR64_18135 [Leptolyngbyaceae cyanobacterium M65_K2018_010]|nr:hypothetical protein [Leptolyngbyaceae cyanobacterium M65_K2018_010]
MGNHRHRLYPLVALLWKRFLNYGNLVIWRFIWQQSQRQQWRSLTAEVTFLWLVGLFGLSFALLQCQHQQFGSVPRGALQLARGLQQMLAIPTPPPSSSGVGLPMVLAVVIGAGLCMVGGTAKLTHSLATLYQGAPSRRRDWGGKLWPLGATLLILLTLLVASGLAPLAGPYQVSEAQSPLGWFSWSSLSQGLRRLASLGILGLGLGLVHRLSPRQWLPGCPLWPGVGLTLVLGLAIWGLGRWSMGWIQAQNIAYGLFLSLSLRLISLFGCLWLIPAGAQFNLLVAGNPRSPRRGLWERKKLPPPSFDSFKIKR